MHIDVTAPCKVIFSVLHFTETNPCTLPPRENSARFQLESSAIFTTSITGTTHRKNLPWHDHDPNPKVSERHHYIASFLV